MPSSAIKHFSYNAGRRELDITFVGSGKTYTYFGVEPEVHNDLLGADSKGRFFNARVKDRYPFRKREFTSPEPRSQAHERAPRVRHSTSR